MLWYTSRTVLVDDNDGVGLCELGSKPLYCVGIKLFLSLFNATHKYSI